MYFFFVVVVASKEWPPMKLGRSHRSREGSTLMNVYVFTFDETQFIAGMAKLLNLDPSLIRVQGVSEAPHSRHMLDVIMSNTVNVD